MRDYCRHPDHILLALGTVSLVRLSVNDVKQFKDRLRDKELSLNAAK